MITHEHASELLAAFALDAVDGEEYEQIEQHLATCPRCRAEFDAHREVAGALGNSVVPLPEGLWVRIARRLPERPDDGPPPMPRLVREESGGGDPREETGADRASTLRPLRSARGRMAILGFIAAAAAAIAAILGVNLVHANNQVTQLRGANGASPHSAVVAALGTPGHKVVHVDTAGHHELAEFVVVPDGRGFLVKSNLPALSSRYTYQLWGVLSGGRPISLGLLGRAPSLGTFTLVGAPRSTVLALTVEPAGGSVTPTGPMLATGTA